MYLTNLGANSLYLCYFTGKPWKKASTATTGPRRLDAEKV